MLQIRVARFMLLLVLAGATAAQAMDTDGDGVLDTSDNCPTVANPDQRDGDGIGPQQSIDPATNPADITAADIDGDGDADVVIASPADSAVVWVENLSPGSFGGRFFVTTNGQQPGHVDVSDLDGDGDPDVVWAATGQIGWNRNLGGGLFDSPQTIPYSGGPVSSIIAADLDADGDPDIVTGLPGQSKIEWSENLGGGSFGPAQTITTTVNGQTSISASDLDGDTDLDIAFTSQSNHLIGWCENLGGGLFGAAQILSGGSISPASVFAGDLDGDGDVDVLTAASGDSTVAWHENLGGGTFGPRQFINTTVSSAQSAIAVDLDRDGDPDVLFASGPGGVHFGWHENLGAGSFGPERTIANSFPVNALDAVDLDGDGDVDVLAALPPGTFRYENLADGVGDACDNCPFEPNATQADADANDIGDACDPCTDTDGDGFGDPGFPATTCTIDNCPDVDNDQSDGDTDDVGDACDNCPFVSNDQIDGDIDGLGDACDNCPAQANPNQDDGDGDMVGDACDNCPQEMNPNQLDTDADGVGNFCDNCPLVSNPSQADTDGDGTADACDNCPAVWNPNQWDTDGDGHADACDNCPGIYNSAQQDPDGDGLGNECDNCTLAANADQFDTDSDGLADACDACPGLALCPGLFKGFAPSFEAAGTYGHAVAISADGSTAVVGAPLAFFDIGEAYVLSRSGAAWTIQATLSPSNIGGDDRFGNSVAISADGSRVIVGSPFGPSGGVVFVFDRAGSSWSETAQIFSPSPSGLFGRSIALSADGSMALVAESEAATVFDLNGTDWFTLTASDGGAGDGFGASVTLAADGQTAVIGAPTHPASGANIRAGAVYAYEFGPSFLWTESSKLTAADASAYDGFGSSIDISADSSTLIVGAWTDDELGSLSGSAYVFVHGGTSWVEQAKLTGADTATPDRFGTAVSLTGDGSVAMIGVPKDQDAGAASGSVYVFERNATIWTQRTKMTPSDVQRYDVFGSSVGLSSDGSRAIAAAPNDDNEDGAVYFFDATCQFDADADNRGVACDCDPSSGDAWEPTGAARDLRFVNSMIATWLPPDVPGGTPAGTLYDTLRSSESSDFAATSICVESDDGSDLLAIDPSQPSQGGVFFYLVRTENSCGEGPVGDSSAGPRPPLGQCP